MNTHDPGILAKGTQPQDESVESAPLSGSDEVSGLFGQMPVLRWVLVLCGVLGVSLAACLLIQPKTAANPAAIGSIRCVCR